MITERALKDFLLVYHHALEKTSSTSRMFFELHKGEPVSSQAINKWSNMVERSWHEPQKWLTMLSSLTENHLTDPPQKTNLNLVSTLQDAIPTAEVLASEIAEIQVARAELIQLGLCEFVRRTYSTQASTITIEGLNRNEERGFKVSGLTRQESTVPGGEFCLFFVSDLLKKFGYAVQVYENEFILSKTH